MPNNKSKFDRFNKKMNFRKKNYFDFGVSSEQDGRVLNTGLSSYKEGFEAHALIHDFYEIKIK